MFFPSSECTRLDSIVCCSFALTFGAGSDDGPSILMEGVRGQHKYHNKQNNDKEENKGWFAVLLLQ